MSPVRHANPHWPQLFGSLFVSVQPSAQHWSTPVQEGPPLQPVWVAVQVLFTHVQWMPGGHAQAWPQPPQLLTLVTVSTHRSPQQVSAPVQAASPPHAPTQTKLVQTSPFGHWLETTQPTH